MKIALLHSCFILYFVSFAQNYSTTAADTNAAKVNLEYITGPRKAIPVKYEDYLQFIILENKPTPTDSNVFNEQIISGKVVNVINDTIILEANSFSKRSFNTFENLFEEQKSIYGGHYTIKLDISEIDGVYHASPERLKARNIASSFIGFSLFTALIIAPLFSIEYKAFGASSPGAFNRNLYFGIAGTGLSVAAISLGFYVASKPKYFSFAKDNYRPKKKRWTLVAIKS